MLRRYLCGRPFESAWRRGFSRPEDHISKPSLKAAKEGHEAGILLPSRRGLLDALAFCQRSGFRGQVDFRIDRGCGNGDVTKPSSNRIDVHTSTQQMRGRGVADDVGTHSFRLERIDTMRCLGGTSFHDSVDTKTSERFPPPVEKHMLLRLASFDQR